MSYLRGRYYAFTCGNADEKDYVALHGEPDFCGCDEHEKTPCIGLPQEVFDALAMMRVAEMTVDQKMRAVVYTIDHARGNAGADALLSSLGARNYWDEEKKWEEVISMNYTLVEKPRVVLRKNHKRGATPVVKRGRKKK